MGSLISTGYIWILIYVIVIILISIFFIRKSVESYGEYAVANKSLGFFFTFFTFFSTWISGATILGLATITFKWGVYQYWFIAITYLVGAVSGPVFLTRIRKLDVYTIGDFFTLRYRKCAFIIKRLLGLSMICRNITIIGAQFTTVAFILSIGFGINFSKALIFTAVFIILYTSLSGLWGVAGTDIIQGIIQMVGLPALIICIVKESGGLSGILDFYYQINGEMFLNIFYETTKSHNILFLFFAPGLFFIIEDQISWQRIQSAKNDKVAFWGYLAPVGAALLWTLIPAFLGVFSKTVFPNFTAFPVALLDYIFSLPYPVMLLVIFAVLSAAISTADSYLLASGVIVSHDLVSKKMEYRLGEKGKIRITQLGIIMTGLLSLYACSKIYDIFELYMLGAYIGGSIITIPYLLTWFSKRMNGIGIIAGMVLGTITFIISAVYYKCSYPFAMIVSMLCNLFGAYLLCFLTNKPDREEINSTYYFSPYFKDIKNIPK